MSRIILYGEYGSLLAARAAAIRLYGLDVALCTSDVKEAVGMAGSVDVVVVCTSAGPEALEQLKIRASTVPSTTFVFLDPFDLSCPAQWLARVATAAIQSETLGHRATQL